jgi:hypothetical protein
VKTRIVLWRRLGGDSPGADQDLSDRAEVLSYGRHDRERKMPSALKQAAWRYTSGNATVFPSEDLGQDLRSWSLLDRPVQQRLTDAISTAPLMVREALGLLTEYLSLEGAEKDIKNGLAKLRFSPTGLALRKYFHLLPVAPKYWHHVRGIIGVFKKIQAGFAVPYKVELDLFVGPFARMNACVKEKSTLKAPVSPIRAHFGFTDEYGHVPYDGIGSVGRIRLSYDYVTAPQTTFDAIARTLVHEMSHRSAMTKDILYKVDCFAKTGLVDDPEQMKVRLPGREKPLTPMTGFADGYLDVIADERYLENADSYAWTARRLWKQTGRPTGG